MLKKKVLISSIIIVLLLILCLHYWEYPIDNDYSCIRFTIGEENYKEVKVKISGIIKKSLLRGDIAELKFQFNDKKFPDTLKHPCIFPVNYSGHVHTDGKIRFNPIDSMQQTINNYEKYLIIDLKYEYWDRDRQKIGEEILGKLIISKNFKAIIVAVLKKDDTRYYSCGFSEGQEIIVSKSNIKDATLLIDDFLKYFIH